MADGRASQTGGTAVRQDPYRVYNFKLEIDGQTAGHFTECTGLEVSVQCISYREAGQGQVVRKLPGHVEYGDVVLRYGLTDSTDLWDWFMESAAGKVRRRNISIILMDPDGVTERTRWNLFSAWPSRWQGAPLNTTAQEIAIESLALVFEELKRA